MDVEKHIEKAQDAIKRRNFDFAINLFQQLLSIDPDNHRAREGHLLASQKAFDMKHAGKKNKKKGGGFGSGLSIAMRSGGRSKPDSVMSACDKVIAKNPYDARAHEKLGYAASKAGHLEAAAFSFQQVADLEPENNQAAKNLGKILQRLGRVPEALAAFDRALKIAPGDQESLKARKDLAAEAAISGAGYAEAKSTMDLLKDKDKVRELELSDRKVLGADEIAESIERLRGQLTETPDDRKALMRLGELQEQAERLDDAKATFAKLLEIDPTNFDVKERIGDLNVRDAEARVAAAKAAEDQDELAAAKRALADLKVDEYAWRVEAHPTDLPMRFRFGEALFRANRLDDAIAEFQKTVKDPRKRLDSQVMMANAFMRKGMLDLAANQLEKALEAAGDGTKRGMDIRYTLGKVFEKQGKHDEARGHYLHIYERDINFRDIRERLEGLQQS